MKNKLSPIKILHLEDSTNDALLISRTLKKNENDFEILVVETKASYIKALKDYKPDIILFDNLLIPFGSKEAVAILKKSKLEIPFILLTETENSDFAVTILEIGASDYILKDRPENLLFYIENTINKFNLEKERLEYNKKIAESERKFKALVQQGSDLIGILDLEGKYKFVSETSYHVLGFAPEEFIGRTAFDFIHPGDKERVIKQFSELEIKKQIEIQPFRFKNAKGEWRWVETKATNLTDDPSVGGIVTNSRDVTERINFQKEIKESEKKYRAFFENSLDGILLTSIDGNIHSANPAACKMFEMTEEEICEKGRSGLVDIKDPRLYEALQERAEKGKTKFEINMLKKDGSIFPAELTSAVIESKNKGSASMTSMIIRDNTDKKHFESELKKSEVRYKSLFKLNPLPTFVFNENDLKILDVNDSACANYGYTREEFLKMTLQDLRSPKEIGHLHQVIEKDRTSDKASFHSYAKHQKKDKSEILVENNSYRFYIDGKPHKVVVCNDITEKDQHLKKIRDTTKKLKLAEKLAKIGYWELDLENDFLYCSDQFLSIFGIKGKDFKPKTETFLKMIHPADRKKYSKEINEVLLGVKGNDMDYRIVLENGSIKWVHSRSKLNKNNNGQITRVKGTIQDITSQKLAYEELAKSESRYKGLVQSQTNYFVRISMDGNYSFCNNKFISEFGWAFPDNNPIGKNSFTDVKEHHHKKLYEIGQKCVSTPNINYQMEIDKRMEDGGTKTTLWDMIYLKTSQSEGEMQCVGIDISKRVKVERENTFQANLLDKIGQGIMATDSQGKLNYWNKGAEAMYHWKKEEVLGKNIFNLLYGDNLDHEKTLQLLRTGESWSGELNATRKDGSSFPTQITKSPLFDESNSFSGVIRVSSDISNLKASEIELKKLNKDLNDYTKEILNANEGLEQFSYIVSHNLRAPVANIIGIADLLENSNHPEEIQKQLLNEIFSNVGRLDDVMEDLNETLKLKADFSKKRETVKLESLIQNIIASNQNLIDKENVSIITDFRAIDEIYTVKSYLYSTFFNLISNSIKYRKPDLSPVIEIRTESQDNPVIIHFKDNGLGIDLKKKGDQIFGFHKRFHNHIEGKGLGLFMVKSQLEMLGGQIKVNSVLGEGTEFIIHLQNN